MTGFSYIAKRVIKTLIFRPRNVEMVADSWTKMRWQTFDIDRIGTDDEGTIGITSPTGRLQQRWFKNAFFSLFGSLGTAAVTLLLPAIVARYLDADAFSLWSLALQIVVYVNLLALGLQVATARAVSYAGDADAEGARQLPALARSARSIASISSRLAVLAIALLVIGYPLVFPSVPEALRGEFRLVLALFGLIAVAQIRAEPEMGVFQGLHRYGVFVGAKFATRVLAVFLVWIGVRAHLPMAILALMMAAAMVLLWPAMHLAVTRWVSWGRAIAQTTVDKEFRRELLHYCEAYSVISVSTLVVNTAGVLIVGHMDFHMTGAYAIAMTAATVPVGLLGALLSPLLTTAAAMYAGEDTRARLPSLLTRSTIIITIGLNIFFAAVAALHSDIVKLWVGESFVATAGPLLVILVGAHCVRNVAGPYAVMLLATGQHRRALWTASLEGVVNLVASIALGVLYGAIGVAIGTLVGSIVGVVGALWVNVSRTPQITPRPLRFTFGAVALPILVFMPLQLSVLRMFV